MYTVAAQSIERQIDCFSFFRGGLANIFRGGLANFFRGGLEYIFRGGLAYLFSGGLANLFSGGLANFLISALEKRRGASLFKAALIPLLRFSVSIFFFSTFVKYLTQVHA